MFKPKIGREYSIQNIEYAHMIICQDSVSGIETSLWAGWHWLRRKKYLVPETSTSALQHTQDPTEEVSWMLRVE